MKKVINGKVYNTETARVIGEYQEGNGFNYIKETLYKSRKGQYFIAGSGGALTRYTVPVNAGGCTGSSNMFLLTKKEAMTWAENHLDVEDYIEEFGEIEG